MPKETSGPTLMKDRISPDVIAHLADLLAAASKSFRRDEFLADAVEGLESMEMKARVLHVADALSRSLPADFPEAAEVIDEALGSPGLNSWMAYPVDDFVARYGIDFPDVALPLMGKLTKRWSCEFAIRPFIREHPKETFAQFDNWIESDDEDLRRLVSEGSRPRLPWGGFIPEFVEDPAPTIALLDRLVDDPSLYVRKSVANHLNDIAKDHPELAIETARRWLDGDPDSERRHWIVGHGMRSLIKAGDPEALALVGYDAGAPVEIKGFEVNPDAIAIGEAVTISFTLVAEEETPVMVDYLVHHAGTKGARSAKVFKLKKVKLSAGKPVLFRREHRIREVSVRKIYPGPHVIEVQVNGRVLAAATVEVTETG